MPMGCMSFQHVSSVSFHIAALIGHVRILCRAVSCSKVAHLVHGVGVRTPSLYSTLLWELSRSSSIVMLFVVGFFHIFRMHSCVCLLCVFIILPFDGLSAQVSICFRVRCSFITSLTPLCMCLIVVLPSESVTRSPAINCSSFSMASMSWVVCLCASFACRSAAAFPIEARSLCPVWALTCAMVVLAPCCSRMAMARAIEIRYGLAVQRSGGVDPFVRVYAVIALIELSESVYSFSATVTGMERIPLFMAAISAT